MSRLAGLVYCRLVPLGVPCPQSGDARTASGRTSVDVQFKYVRDLWLAAHYSSVVLRHTGKQRDCARTSGGYFKARVTLACCVLPLYLSLHVNFSSMPRGSKGSRRPKPIARKYFECFDNLMCTNRLLSGYLI